MLTFFETSKTNKNSRKEEGKEGEEKVQKVFAYFSDVEACVYGDVLGVALHLVVV